MHTHRGVLVRVISPPAAAAAACSRDCAGVSIYAFVVTHNLHLDEYFARAAVEHDAPGLSAQELFGQAFVDTNDPEAFAARLTTNGAFGK
jgi:hypothetical protein